MYTPAKYRTAFHHADLIDWLRGRQWLVQNGFMPKYHAAFMDPPYFLGSINKRYGKQGSAVAHPAKNGIFRYDTMSKGFMGKQWDGFDSVWHYQAWITEWATLMIDFLYPGAVIAVCGGTRTFHRLASGLEDAGFEVFDVAMWIHGQGFPKSHQVGCKCGYKTNTTNSKAKHTMRPVRKANLSRAVSPEAESREVLQPGMSKQNPQEYGSAGTKPEVADGKESGVERGKLYRARKGLQNDPATQPSPRPEKWLHLRAHSHNGARNWPPAAARRRSASYRRKQVKQSPVKPETVQQSPRALGYGASRGNSTSAPVCPKCGGVVGFGGHGSALKPAYEPLILARAPRGKHTFAELAQQYGSGALNVDGCRIDVAIDDPNKRRDTGGHTRIAEPEHLYGKGLYNSTRPATLELGRWPANIILDESAAGLLDEMTPERTQKPTGDGLVGSKSPFFKGLNERIRENHSDEGGTASRFFYTAKAASWEREAGLHHRDQTTVGDGRAKSIDNPYQRGETKRRNTHPTVKPIRLTEYIARLLLPPALNEPRRILIPFGGVGSEVIGALLAGWDQVVSIEREAEYIPLHRERVAWWQQFKSYDQAEAAFKADMGEQNQRDEEQAAGVAQLPMFAAGF